MRAGLFPDHSERLPFGVDQHAEFARGKSGEIRIPMIGGGMQNQGYERLRTGGFAKATLALVAASGLIVGCGGDEVANGRKPSMLGSQTQDASTRPSGSNSAPRIESVRLNPERPAPGRVIQARAIARDDDGDATEIAYRWESDDGSLLGEGPRFDTTGLSSGERITVIVVASDGQDESAELSRTVRLAEQSAQVAIVAIDTSQGQSPGATLSAHFESTEDGFSDMDAEYEWRVNGEAVSSDEKLKTAAYSPGDVITLRARLDDGNGRPSRFVTSRPIILARNDAPEILSQPLAGVEAGLFRYQVRAKSPSPDAQLSYELLNGPQGMTVDATSGLMEWRPSSSQRGRFEIEVAVKDQWGSGAAQSFAIEADAPVAPPASRR